MSAPELPLLLSRRASARLLGVGRNETFQGLIDRGAIRPVIVDGREFFSRAELEEFARVGETNRPATRKKPAPRKGSGRIPMPVEPTPVAPLVTR
jgi:hypothetical protein